MHINNNRKSKFSSEKTKKQYSIIQHETQFFQLVKAGQQQQYKAIKLNTDTCVVIVLVEVDKVETFIPNLGLCRR